MFSDGESLSSDAESELNLNSDIELRCRKGGVTNSDSSSNK